jgi:leader peptidase (prepilin peptidase)/N-methyltransferase
MLHAIFIIFLFALGACVGSFLNVVVWRLPRDESLVRPPSHCPKCNTNLSWRDNIPVFGWLLLGGKCRYCREPISLRYPIVEFVTGAIFVLYYGLYFIAQKGPCPPMQPLVPRPLDLRLDWPIYAIHMYLLATLLAASLIDAELFIIPVEMTWWAAGVGLVVHALVDLPSVPGALVVPAPAGAMAAGGSIGLIISLVLLKRRIIPTSFAEIAPLMEHERERHLIEANRARAEGRELPPEQPDMTPAQIRTEVRKEILFLLPPLLLATSFVVLYSSIPTLRGAWDQLMRVNVISVSGFLGAALGALVGGLVVWVTRVLGTLAFGREAMGMGDVHLMFGVGAVVGAGPSVVAFFVAPFFGILVAIYMLLTGTRRELPYGPYLSLGTAFAMVWYCDIANGQIGAGVRGIGLLLRDLVTRTGGGA